MEQQKDYLFDLLEKISNKLDRSFGDLKPFYWILKENWYDNEAALKEATDAQYAKMKIPVRLYTAIREELGISESKVLNNQTVPIEGSIQEKNTNILSGQNSNERCLTEVMMVQYCNQLEAKLQKRFTQNPEQIKTIFQTLYKIIHNIVKDQSEMKFRNLKFSNSMVQRVILKNAPVKQFLFLFGFQEDDQRIHLEAPAIHELIFVDEVLFEISEKYNNSTYSPFLGDIKMPQKPQIMQNGFNNSNNSNQKFGSFEEQFQGQNMVEVKYVDALDRLIKFRQSLMSQPPKNRQIRIYHKRHQTKNNCLPEVSMQQQLQKSDDKAVQSYWKDLITQNKKNANFQSKRKQEFNFLVKQKIHKETIIKIKLPNEYIIEARFGPLEKLKNVFSLVGDIIIGDLYLYHAPPVKRYDKDMQKTLDMLDSVPTGSFYMGSNGQYYINNKYSKIVQK